MSGRYVTRVLESGLPLHLTRTAVACATFADDKDGRRIWPSVKTLTDLTRQSERTVQNHLKALRELDVLEVVEPATRYRATHYRMVLEKLPRRDPDERPPASQVAAPIVAPMVAPMPWVQDQPVMGATQVAPDPSVRSSSTHTYRARARERAPEPKLPLVGAVPHRAAGEHRAHAWCSRRGICVTKFLHREFVGQIGGPARTREARVFAFYAETMTDLSHRDTIGDVLKFWRAAFDARFGTVAPGRSRPSVPSTTLGDDVWSDVLRRLELKVSKHNFWTWFRGTELARDRRTLIEVAAPLERGQFITKHFSKELTAAVEEVRAGTRVVFVETKASSAKRRHG